MVQFFYLILGLQHFGSSLLDPMVYVPCSIVHTNEMLYVTAMLSVASVEEKLCIFSGRIFSPLLLPLLVAQPSGTARARLGHGDTNSQFHPTRISKLPKGLRDFSLGTDHSAAAARCGVTWWLRLWLLKLRYVEVDFLSRKCNMCNCPSGSHTASSLIPGIRKNHN